MAGVDVAPRKPRGKQRGNPGRDPGSLDAVIKNLAYKYTKWPLVVHLVLVVLAAERREPAVLVAAGTKLLH